MPSEGQPRRRPPELEDHPTGDPLSSVKLASPLALAHSAELPEMLTPPTPPVQVREMGHCKGAGTITPLHHPSSSRSQDPSCSGTEEADNRRKGGGFGATGPFQHQVFDPPQSLRRKPGLREDEPLARLTSENSVFLVKAPIRWAALFVHPHI